MTHPENVAYECRRANPWRLCWTCLNTGYRATVYRTTNDPAELDIERRDPCSCHVGTLAHLRDGLKNLPIDRRPVPLSPSAARLERVRAGLVAAGIAHPPDQRTI